MRGQLREVHAMSGGGVHSQIAGPVMSKLRNDSPVSGRSPSLVAMERVMPKYASWSSSPDVNSGGLWCRTMDSHNVDKEFDVYADGAGTVGSPCRNMSSTALRQGPTTAAVGCDPGETTDLKPPFGNGQPSNLTPVPDHRAKDQLLARLTHLPASDSAVLPCGHGGKILSM